MKNCPITLIILDGFGTRDSTDFNAIRSAKTPHWDKIWQEYPHTTLNASGTAVGLPDGQMGNSEVGHLTMGAGRVIYQELPKITSSIHQGDFFENKSFTSALKKAKEINHSVHILGLLSPGGVHSHEEHIHAMVKLAAKEGIQNIFIHAFLDGRDTPPQSAKGSLIALQEVCRTLPPTSHARIASICGRYYVMDRDKRWERTQEAYDMLTAGKAAWFASSALEALTFAYNRGETDEFVKPTLISPTAIIEKGDVVFFMNFRADRARQLSYALHDPNFKAFPRGEAPTLTDFVTLTEYATDLNANVAFMPETPRNMLGEYLQQQGLRQLRIAETEKYAHVTFFFNGGRETPFIGEERLLIPSKKIATYDLQPEMSAYELTDALIKAIEEERFDIIICNYANADMVGHTGNFNASIKAVEVLDTCLGKVIAALKKKGGEAIITADHGNVELMFDPLTQQPHTAHTLEEVPFVYIGRKASIALTEKKSLADIAPTLISLLGKSPPLEMTGKSLVVLDPI